MTVSFKFHLDAGLTAEVAGLPLTGLVDGSSADVDGVAVLGSNVLAKKIQAVSDPGVDPIIVSITDSAPGANLEAANFKLATSNAGLTAAVAGAPLNLPATLNSEVANGLEVHFRCDTPALVAPDSTVGLQLNLVQETAV